jgi:membrane-bound serine protease (ClpP class)
MAPGTNVGAATPVQLGGAPEAPEKEPPADKEDEDKEEDGEKEPEAAPPSARPTMSDKVVSDAAAYIRSLALMRGRNAEWAEKAVREAASLAAEDALQAYVIDLMANDVADLLEKLDGRTVTVLGQERRLQTAGARIIEIEPDWRSELLALITNPNVAYILLMLAFYGILFEFMNPGAIVPGVVGAICLLLALYALQALPVNYAGLALILLGIAFMVGEAFVPSFGILGIGGLVAFVIGSVMLIDTEIPGYGIAWPVIVAVSATSGAFFLLVIGMALKAHRRQVVSGREELIGSYGRVVDWTDREGRASVRGELWRATASVPLEPGKRVRIAGLEGLHHSHPPGV